MRFLARAAILVTEFLALGALLVGWIVAPPMRQPAHADVVVLLSGDGDRLSGALRLMDRRVAPTLVFVGTPDTLPVVDLCRLPQPFEVICLRPQPDNTRTEAKATGRLARTRKWDAMVVVTSRYHATRARMLFRRCFRGVLAVIGDYPHHGREFSRRQIRREVLAAAYTSVFTRGC